MSHLVVTPNLPLYYQAGQRTCGEPTIFIHEDDAWACWNVGRKPGFSTLLMSHVYTVLDFADCFPASSSLNTPKIGGRGCVTDSITST